MTPDTAVAAPHLAPHLDRVQGFIIPERHARGRLVRLGPALDRILAAHGYPPVLERVLAEALAVTALLGATLKDAGGQMTLQAQTEGGVVDLLVCDYRGGEMRGYLRHDPERLAEMPAEPSLFALFGKGYLAITFDQAKADGAGKGGRYQGIVPLEGGSIAEAVESYFAQSEQIPSLVRVAIGRDEGGRRIAGGLLVQHLPEGEEGRDRIHTRLDHPEWEQVAALARTISPAELLDPRLALEAVVWRLFNEETVLVTPATPLARGCRCDPGHIRQVLARFPADERAAMADAAGVIRVDCEFCASSFGVTLAELG